MKFKKTLCVLLIIVIVAGSSVSCSSGGKALFKFRDTELSTNMYSYMLSSQKAFLKDLFDYYNTMSYYYYGTYYFGTADFDEYLISSQPNGDGTTSTVAQITNDMVIESAKSMVIINHFCKQYNLEVTDTSTVDAIDSTLSEDIEAAGSVEYYNILLSQFGADYDIAKKYLYDSSSSEVLFSYLYGENGTQRLDDSLVKEQFAKDYSKIDVLYYPYYDKDAESGDSSIKEVEGIDDAAIRAFTAEKYAKIRQILFYTIDLTSQSSLGEEKVKEQKEKAEQIYAEIKEGKITFDAAREANNEDTNKNAVLVSEGSQDARIKSVEDAALGMKAGEYALVKSEIGYHIITREAIEDADITDAIRNEAYEKLAKNAINDFARAAYDKVIAGTLKFSDYKSSGESESPNPDAYGKYTPGIIYSKEEIDEEIFDKVNEMQYGEYAVVEISSGCCVLLKLKPDDDDYLERYDDIYDALADEAFEKFIKSYYPEVVVDEAELAKYDFLTAISLDLVPLDEVSE